MLLPMFLVLPLVAGLTPQAQKPPGRTDAAEIAAFRAGLKLTQAEVSGVEKRVAESPNDENARLELLGHYSLVKNGDGKNGNGDFENQLLWLVDHDPASWIFGVPILHLGWDPPARFMNEYVDHWKRAVVAHPQDSAVLSHAAEEVVAKDFNLGLLYARKSVQADASCTHCRSQLGEIIGSAVIRQPLESSNCLPDTPDVRRTVSKLRNEIASSSDPEMVLAAGMEIKGRSRVYGSRCGGNSDEAARFGGELIRKAVDLDPSLIDRYHLQDVLHSIH